MKLQHYPLHSSFMSGTSKFRRVLAHDINKAGGGGIRTTSCAQSALVMD